MSVINILQYIYHSAIWSILLYIHFAIALKHFEVLYSWIFFSCSVRSHWLLRDHIASNNETVSLEVINYNKRYWMKINNTPHPVLTLLPRSQAFFKVLHSAVLGLSGE